jgi:alkylhydroperoxidase family enzyme
MPHIAVPTQRPGIRGLMASKPASGVKLNELAQQLLRGDSPLTPGERELIAAYVSSLNRTRYCTGSHSAAAAHTLDGGYPLVEAVLADVTTAPVDDRMRALLHLAGKVQAGGLNVTPD